MKRTPKVYSIRFTGKGQVAIPRWLRKELDIVEGTRALVVQDGDTVVLTPITPKFIRNLRGSLKCSGVLKALMDGRKQARELK